MRTRSTRSRCGVGSGCGKSLPTLGASDVRHDQDCERNDVVASIYSTGCKCASRAWQRDPLPDDVTPVWTPVWAIQPRLVDLQ